MSDVRSQRSDVRGRLNRLMMRRVVAERVSVSVERQRKPHGFRYNESRVF
jgi:hypothetical protein